MVPAGPAVAVQFTVVTPIGNVPLDALHAIVTFGSTMSLAVGVKP
jgi:hypothetical protein